MCDELREMINLFFRQMKTFEESVKAQKTVGSMIIDNKKEEQKGSGKKKGKQQQQQQQQQNKVAAKNQKNAANENAAPAATAVPSNGGLDEETIMLNRAKMFERMNPKKPKAAEK